MAAGSDRMQKTSGYTWEANSRPWGLSDSCCYFMSPQTPDLCWRATPEQPYILSGAPDPHDVLPGGYA